MKLKTNSVTSCTVRELELKKKDERERRNARVKAVGRIFEYSRVLPPTKATSRLNVTRQTEPAEHQQQRRVGQPQHTADVSADAGANVGVAFVAVAVTEAGGFLL